MFNVVLRSLEEIEYDGFDRIGLSAEERASTAAYLAKFDIKRDEVVFHFETKIPAARGWNDAAQKAYKNLADFGRALVEKGDSLTKSKLS